MSTDELQHAFDSELPLGVKELLTYARNFVEFCSFKALQKLSRTSDYLSDAEFRRLAFDAMLAWEAPSVHTEQLTAVQIITLINDILLITKLISYLIANNVNVL